MHGADALNFITAVLGLANTVGLVAVNVRGRRMHRRQKRMEHKQDELIELKQMEIKQHQEVKDVARESTKDLIAAIERGPQGAS